MSTGACRGACVAALCVSLFVGCKDSSPRAGAASDGGATATPSAVSSAAKPAATTSIIGTPVSAEQIAAAVNPEKLPAYKGPTGSVEGVVTVTGDASPPLEGVAFPKCPAARETHRTLFREGAKLPSGARPVADAIVAVTGYAGYFLPERRPAAKVVIGDCSEAPRTIVLTFGQRLEVLNRGSFLFAPILEPVADPAVMMAPPGATDPVRLYPRKPGRYRLADKMSGDDFITADVFTLLHPLHDVTTIEGRYRIDGVPVGKLKVGARIVPVSAEAMADVDVRDGVVTRADLVIAYKAAPAVDAGAAKKPAEIIH